MTEFSVHPPLSLFRSSWPPPFFPPMLPRSPHSPSPQLHNITALDSERITPHQPLDATGGSGLRASLNRAINGGCKQQVSCLDRRLAGLRWWSTPPAEGKLCLASYNSGNTATSVKIKACYSQLKLNVCRGVEDQIQAHVETNTWAHFGSLKRVHYLALQAKWSHGNKRISDVGPLQY